MTLDTFKWVGIIVGAVVGGSILLVAVVILLKKCFAFTSKGEAGRVRSSRLVPAPRVSMRVSAQSEDSGGDRKVTSMSKSAHSKARKSKFSNKAAADERSQLAGEKRASHKVTSKATGDRRISSNDRRRRSGERASINESPSTDKEQSGSQDALAAHGS